MQKLSTKSGKLNPTVHQKDHIPHSAGIDSRDARMIQYSQTNVIYHINKVKNKSHIISTDAEKPFDIIQHPFVIKNSPQSGYTGDILQHNKTIYDKPTANGILNSEN